MANININRKFILILMGFLFFGASIAMADPIPVGQDVGATEKRLRLEKEQKAIQTELKQEKKVEVEETGEGLEKTGQPLEGTETVLIHDIQVVGATLLSPEKIEEIVAPYKGQQLSLNQFNEVAERITDEYRSRGYVTSFAFLPPQRIAGGILQVNVTEGKLGNVTFSGNRWFKTKRLSRYVEMQQDELFNYDKLRQNIRMMNEHPDRQGRVVLTRGEAPGTTDVNVEVKEQFPWHVTLGYNNYNSRYLERNKYSTELRSNNFLGFDDILVGEAQFGEAGRFQLYSVRYLFPLTTRVKIGTYYVHVNQHLGRELGDFKIEGEADVLNTFLNIKIIDKENFTLGFTPAFEVKNIENRLDGEVNSKDELRIIKLGFDVDFRDSFRGRNILTQEFGIGIDDFMGSSANKDDLSSRPGAGGRFFNSSTNVARLQALPYSLILMLKGAMQISNYNMPSSEQFQIGGFYTVRGYPVSEYGGDSGYTLTTELTIPPYFIPKDYQIPFTDSTWREGFAFHTFFDWGYVSNNSPKLNETKDEAIYSVGWGFRFNPHRRLSVSFDHGIPIAQKTSDGSSSIAYIETKWIF